MNTRQFFPKKIILFNKYDAYLQSTNISAPLFMTHCLMLNNQVSHTHTHPHPHTHKIDKVNKMFTSSELNECLPYK